MATKKQSKAQEQLQRRAIVAELYSKGVYQSDIATKLKVSLPTVQRDLAAVRKQWLESSLQDFDQVKADQLAKLDEVERQAWLQWERTCKTYKKKTVTEKEMMGDRDRGNEDESEGGKPAIVGTDTKVETIHQFGDPRFLTVVLSVVDRRCKLLGLDAPAKVAPTNPDGSEPYSDPASMTAAERQKRIAELEAKLGRGSNSSS